jgi:hypothetical protein
MVHSAACAALPHAGVAGFDESPLQVLHVRVFVPKPLRLAQPDAVDLGRI